MSQNSSTSSSNARRFVGGFLLGTLLLLLPGVILSFYLQPLSGDLTRIGNLAERDFGATQPQAALNRQANDASPADADVLVLGDSFSAQNAWQTELSKRTGQMTLSYHYDELPCLDYWLEQAASGKLSNKARTLIIQSSERDFMRRFTEQSSACEPAHLQASTIAAETLTSQRSRLDLLPMNIMHVLKTLSNHLAMSNKSGKDRFQRTIMVNLTRNDLFSNRLSGHLLYYAVDIERREQYWSPERADQALAYLARYRDMAAARGVRLLVIAIPDKSSVYAPWIAAGQLPLMPGYNLHPRLASQFGHYADLLTPFREAAGKSTDFYAPNDTHLSLDGYRLLGRFLATQVKQ
ncbi:MAG: hypothetical protein V4688_06195 [Pseudomonadota bacterium]